MTTASPPPPPVSDDTLPPGLILLLATACGLIAANIYYAQPLIAPIASDLGIAAGSAGMIVTMCQLGYGLGLLFIVPLGDLIENRRLILSVMALGIVALAAAALSTGAAMFLCAALFIGLGSVSVQVIVPFAAGLASDAARGRVVGSVMSGLMLGIMLARPVASALTAASSWHAVFWVSSLAMLGLAVVLRLRLPQRRPRPGQSYGGILLSMGRLVATQPELRRRALAHACLFGGFSLFWTVVPLHLAANYGLTQRGIALFALAGVAGAVAAPIAGRMADRGWARPGTIAAIGAAALAFVIGRIGLTPSAAHLGLLVLAAIVLDFAVTSNLVLSQREIYGLDPEARSRINGLFMATFFAGGAAGSAVGGWAWAQGGWALSGWIGFALPLAALAVLALSGGQRATAPG